MRAERLAERLRAAINSLNSNGICSLTVSQKRPTLSAKPCPYISSYVNIASGKSLREGGHNYSAIIRKTPKKPLHFCKMVRTTSTTDTATGRSQIRKRRSHSSSPGTNFKFF